MVNGATKLVRNLSIAGKRKKTKVIGYENVKPEIIDLAENLNNLGIDQNQLIVLAMIIGTDFNPGGIKGIGPKNALKLVKEYKKDFKSLFNTVKWNEHFDFSWEEVFDVIKKMPVTDDYEIEFGKINEDKIIKMLVDEHDFSIERVNSTLEKLSNGSSKKQQSSLSDF